MSAMEAIKRAVHVGWVGLLLVTAAACAPGGNAEMDRGVECGAAFECASSVCLPVEAGRRVCTSTCASDADCVAGWSCDAFGGVSDNVCLCRAEPEACDGEDDDCDGTVDEACGAPSEDPEDGGTDPEPTDPTPTDPTPTDPAPSVDPCLAADVAASAQSSCAVAMDENLYCWGGVVWSNEDYEPGYYALGPEPVIVGEEIAQIADGGLHLCALTADARLLCRGDNGHGQLGLGHRSDLVAAEVVDGDWAEVSTGYIHTCGIKSDGTLWCWGFGGDGALGLGDYDDRLSPTRVGTNDTWEHVAAGRFGTCALRNGGEVHCWGTDWPGASGALLTPTRMGTRSQMIDIDVGTSSACAIRDDGALFCWGYSTHGEVGRGFTIDYAAPIQVGDRLDWVDIAVGSDHVCGIAGEEIWCWGDNRVGQLGIGAASETPSLEPVIVRSDGGWSSIRGTGHHTCALRDGGRLYCWGENRSGESGGGDADSVTEPRELCVTDWSA
jgi:alpha-tubulin suppressor-like RCC1 family protein